MFPAKIFISIMLFVRMIKVSFLIGIKDNLADKFGKSAGVFLNGNHENLEKSNIVTHDTAC